MKNILVISGHNDLNHSVANKQILSELEKRLPNLKISYLDKLYPDYKIKVEAEQEKLIWADLIILQYPIFWYGMPSLLKKWMEDVFEHGFSHGDTGDKLKGKKIIVSFTTGAKEEIYSKDTLGYEIEDFLHSIIATCHLCGLKYLGYVYTGGVSYQMRTDIESINMIKEKAISHVDRLIDMIKEGVEENE